MIRRERPSRPRRLAGYAAIAVLCVTAGATAQAGQVQPDGSTPAPPSDTDPSDTTVSGVDVPAMIQAADWIYFPSHFPLPKIAGKVVLKCKVLPTTSVSDCSVVSDTGPPSRVLGEAALRASALFKIRPRMVGGTLSDNAWVLIPISFNSAPSKP
jgi:TonB family protein